METADILKKPFKDLGKLLLSGILSALLYVTNTLAIVTGEIWGVVLLGFGLDNAKKPGTLPDFKIEQLIFGLKAVLIIVMYQLVPSIITFWGYSQNLFVIVALGYLAALAVAPLWTRAILAMSKEGRISDGLKIKDMMKQAYSSKFLNVWAIAAVLWFSVSFVVGLVPYVGPPISIYVSQIIYFTYLGANYKF